MAAEPARRQERPGASATARGDLGAWDKLQLGWLDYETVVAGQNKTLDLGPHEYNTAKAAGRRRGAAQEAGHDRSRRRRRRGHEVSGGAAPATTSNNTLTRHGRRCPRATSTLSLPGAAGTSRTAGRTRATTRTSRSTTAPASRPSPASITKPAEGNGIDGVQRRLEAGDVRPVGLRRQDGRRCASATRPTGGAAGGKRLLRRRDHGDRRGARRCFTDGAEAGANGWTANGFSAVGSSVTQVLRQLLHRRRTGRTRRTTSTCKTGPYNFGFATTRPDCVEHFPYQDGLLVSYWDTSQQRQQHRASTRARV